MQNTFFADAVIPEILSVQSRKYVGAVSVFLRRIDNPLTDIFLIISHDM